MINLAPDHVPSLPGALPVPSRQFYVDVRAADGQSLTDKVCATLGARKVPSTRNARRTQDARDARDARERSPTCAALTPPLPTWPPPSPRTAAACSRSCPPSWMPSTPLSPQRHLAAESSFTAPKAAPALGASLRPSCSAATRRGACSTRWRSSRIAAPKSSCCPTMPSLLRSGLSGWGVRPRSSAWQSGSRSN